MRNLTNNINRINKKADNEKRRVDVRKYRAIGKAMAAHQDEIDKLNSLLHKLGVQMDERVRAASSRGRSCRTSVGQHQAAA